MSVIDTLLRDVPAAHRKELERIRALIKKVCPDAEEVMTYGMPGFKYKGKYLVAFANFKDHMSLFPGAEPIEILGDELRNYKTSKGTIQFTLENNVSDVLVQKIVQLSAERIEKTGR
jgi:uncharacterized protein YdhG (YjbR/CyaY superfamily)